MIRTRNVWIGLLAAVMAACVVYGLFHLQQLQLLQRDMATVIVPTRFIGAGEQISDKDVGLLTIPLSVLDSDMLQDISEVRGKETIVPLGKGEPILSWKLDRFRLQPSRSQSTFQIPREYIRSISNGIRAGDKVLLYASGTGVPLGRLFEEAVTVASVKTSGNLEIDNVSNPNLLSLAEGNMEQMYASRRDANGMIDYLNLNLTEEEWLKLDALCRDGTAKLVVAYSSASYDLLTEGEEP